MSRSAANPKSGVKYPLPSNCVDVIKVLHIIHRFSHILVSAAAEILFGRVHGGTSPFVYCRNCRQLDIQSRENTVGKLCNSVSVDCSVEELRIDLFCGVRTGFCFTVFFYVVRAFSAIQLIFLFWRRDFRVH